MTKKDYVLIAPHYHFIKAYLRDTITLKQLTDIVTEMADRLASDNPLFNYQKFYKACGVGLTGIDG